MVNAITLAIKFQNHMPAQEVPEKTEGYEGFIHLMNFNGHIEEANYLILFVTMIVQSSKLKKHIF